jgi:hypothetical protein
MSKSSQDGSVNLAVPSVVVVVISLVMALAAADIGRPQQNQPSLETPRAQKAH